MTASLEAELGPLEARIGTRLRGIEGESSAMRAALENMLAQPHVVQGVNQITAGAQPSILNLGGPVAGKDWEVRRVSIGPAVIGAAVPAAPGILIVTRGSSAEVCRFTTAAGFQVFGQGELYLRFPDFLGVFWSGGTAGAQLIVDWQAEESASSIDWNP